MSEYIKKEELDGVMMLTIARPAKKNALTLAMYDALADAFDDASARREVRVILLSGEGGCFSSGNDIQDFMKHPPTSEDTPVFRFLRALSAFEKPVVVAVAGPAVGIGTTLLLHSDIVFAAPSAKFQLPFVKLALVPEAASSLLLPAMMGHQRAAALLMLAEPFGAATALDVGIISKVSEEASLLDDAKRAAKKLAKSPPEALRLTKKLMKSGLRGAINEQMSVEGAFFIKRLRSPEATEAFTAFAQKRAPDFSKF